MSEICLWIVFARIIGAISPIFSFNGIALSQYKVKYDREDQWTSEDKVKIPRGDNTLFEQGIEGNPYYP